MPDQTPDLPKLSFDDGQERSTFDKTAGESVQPQITGRPRSLDDETPRAPLPHVGRSPGGSPSEGRSVEMPNLDFGAEPEPSAPQGAPAPQASHSPYGTGPNMAAAAGPMYASQPTWREKIPGARYLPTMPQILLVLLAVGGLYVWRNWNREMVPTEVDRGLVVSAEWLAEYSREFEFLPSAEQLVKHKTLFGRMRLDYHYQSGEPGQPEVLTTVRIYPSASEAEAEFQSVEIANMLAWRRMSQGSAGILEFDEDCSWGEESRAFLVEIGGQPAGHSFYARMGRRRIDVTIKGVVFRDGWELFEVLKPALRGLAAYRP